LGEGATLKKRKPCGKLGVSGNHNSKTILGGARGGGSKIKGETAIDSETRKKQRLREENLNGCQEGVN